MQNRESVKWRCRYQLKKYVEDIRRSGVSAAEFQRACRPYEVRRGEGNCLLNAGCDEIWDLVCGDSSNYFNNAGAQIGVGDSNTAASPSQTDLQAATNKAYKGMDSGYPTSTAQKAVFKASFGSGEANFTWNEWVVKQAASGKCLNRRVENLGTKSGGTWVLQVEITLS